MSAMDVIVTVDKEGSMRSSPFCVSFAPHIAFLRQVVVEQVILEINGVVKSDISLLKDIDGEVYFVDDEAAGANNYSKVPSHENLLKMGLLKGENVVRFTTVNTHQFTYAKIFVWSTNAKIVVTDIDGTITRSDVRGHLCSKLRMKWHHNSVCECFKKVRELGYQVVYLTARSISMEHTTRKYLQDMELPSGPVLLSRKRFAGAVASEIIKKDAKLEKAEHVTNILNLFPAGSNPIVAGFGNNENDNWVYRNAGIPESHIFIVNKKSEILVSSSRTSYEVVAAEVCKFFQNVLDVDVC